MPRPPWKWILGLGGFLALSIGGMMLHDREEAETLRGELKEAHQRDLGPLVARYEALIGRINGWVVAAAAKDELETYVDPRLSLDALHADRGLYLRIAAEDAHDPASIVRALKGSSPDAIARCLGVSPDRVGELLTRGSFLTGAWIGQADTDSVMKLRVLAEELRQRSERDLPFVGQAMQARWLLFVLERGEDRRSAPVDVYLYNLDAEELLLRSRVRAQGALISARIAVGGIKPGAYASGAQTGGAGDCAIAHELRALTGQEPVRFESNPPSPRAAYDEQLGTHASPGGGASAAPGSKTDASAPGAKAPATE